MNSRPFESAIGRKDLPWLLAMIAKVFDRKPHGSSPCVLADAVTANETQPSSEHEAAD